MVVDPAIADRFAWPGWQLVENADAAGGMASSLRMAVLAASDSPRLVLMNADMPFISVSHLRALTAAGGPRCTLHPDGRRGVPAAFCRAQFDELRHIQGDTGARTLLTDFDTKVIRPDEPMALFDIDCTRDLATAHLWLSRDEGAGLRR